MLGDARVLHRALTHSSHVHEKTLIDGSDALRDNEQLEFLGDAVLGFLISESLVAPLDRGGRDCLAGSRDREGCLSHSSKGSVVNIRS